jgi:hypothetical protein
VTGINSRKTRTLPVRVNRRHSHNVSRAVAIRESIAVAFIAAIEVQGIIPFPAPEKRHVPWMLTTVLVQQEKRACAWNRS